MAGRARTTTPQVERRDENETKAAEGGTGGPRTATLDLPFVTAQFRAPDLHVPSREELGEAVRGAQSMLPSRSSMLFYGGLAVTAALGAIEWPVAAAIGVGSALASRGAANPQPRGASEGAGRSDGQEGESSSNR
jgi:hypothetical protein